MSSPTRRGNWRAMAVAVAFASLAAPVFEGDAGPHRLNGPAAGPSGHHILLPAEPTADPNVGERHDRHPTAPSPIDRPRLGFEAVEAGPDVAYVARGRGYAVEVAARRVRLALAPGADLGTSDDRERPQPVQLDMVLAGAAGSTLLPGPASATVNYLIGDESSAWRTGVPLFDHVTAEGIYPGIDAVYYGNRGRLQYDFLVHPGADPRAIRLRFEGATAITLTETGDLDLRIGDQRLLMQAPVIYQERDGVRRPVAGRFLVDARTSEVGFEVGDYDTTSLLVIDPVLEYGTYFSSTGPETDARNVGVDAAGNVYFAGSTNGAFGAAAKPFGTYGGGTDAYVTKFAPDGRPVFTTYFGGSGTDRVTAVEVTRAGEVVIGGTTTSANLPGAGNPAFYDAQFTGNNDGFVVKLTSTGTLAWMSYIGGAEGANDVEQVNEVAVDAAGSVVVAGSIVAFPGPVDGYDQTPNGLGDALLVRFSAAGARVAASWLGTSAREDVTGLALHPASGEVLVSGRTFSNDLPVTPGAWQSQCATVRPDCAWLARFSLDLRALRLASYFGASATNTSIDDIAVDADGSLVLVGGIGAGSIPATTGDTTHNGNIDAFLARMSGDGGTLLMLTYLGGAQFDAAAAVAIDRGGQLYVAGSTASTNFPVTPGAFRSQLGGTQDGFLAKFLPDGSAVTAATFVGSNGFDFVPAVTLTPEGIIYLVGFAGGSGLAVTADAFDAVFSQSVGEAFLYRLSPDFDAEAVLPASGGARSIPDAFVTGSGIIPGTVTWDLSVTGAQGILDSVAVSLHVTHAVRRQLRVTLLGPGPDATRPRVIVIPASTVPAGANFGSSCNAGTTLSDAAASSIASSVAPSAGAFRPVNALAPFAGLPAGQVNGTWSLRIEDTTAGTTGTFQCWTLTLRFRRPSITRVSPAGRGVPAAGSAVTITGAGYQPGAQVRIGGRLATVTSVDATVISALVPAGVGASPDVAVTNPDGRSAVLVDPFNRVTFRGARVGDQVNGQMGVSTGNVVQPSLSRDGRWLAFHTGTPVMVPDDTNGVADVFVRDRAATGAPRIVRVSVASDGTQGNGPSTRAKISADGRYVAFLSSASNLVPGDTNGVADVFVHDRDADGNGVFDETGPGRRATFRVSVASTGQQANGASSEHDLSPDGFWVTFVSSATNLVTGDTNGVADVFLHHWPSGQTIRASVSSAGVQANGPSRAPGVSAGGRRLVFASDASNLVASDANNARDVFVFDRIDRTTTRVSTAHGSTADANGPSDNPSIDDRGGTIAFQTRATNILPPGSALTGSSWQVVVLRLPAATPFEALASADGFARIGEPVVDIAAAIRNLISGNAQGQAGQGNSTAPSVNGDGTAVSFQSDGDDLVLGDSNGQPDVFVASTSGGEPEIVSLTEDGQQGNEPSQQAVLSDDGSTVAFESQAPLTPDVQSQPNQNLTNVFVRGPQLLLSAITPPALPTIGGTRTVTVTGTGFVNPVKLYIGGVAAPILSESTDQIVATAPEALTGGAVNVTVVNAGGESTTAVNGFTYLSSGADSDGDGMTDDYEAAFGLDPFSSAGENGAAGDPDGDGVLNLDESVRGTHPRGVFTRFLAEGAVSQFFTTRIALANPSDAQTVRALLRYQKRDGSEVRTFVTLPPRQSRKVTVNQVPGMVPAEFATLVESDGLLVVDRQMWWDSATAYGSHADTAVRAPGLVWYLAEGATHSGFDLFYLLQNPSPTQDAEVQVRYLLPSGSLPPKTYLVPANSRQNIWVDLEEFPNGSGNTALANTDVSAVLEVRNGVPIIVERAMYLSRGGQLFTAGHESAAIAAPALEWFLAEGATGPFFDLFLLFANPNPTPAQVLVTYLLEDGRTFSREITVRANSRQNIWVDAEEDFARAPGPGELGVSTRVGVLNGVPIIVERAMWWPGNGAQWYEAHNSPGSTVTGTLWGLAEGAALGAPSFTSCYILVANPSSQDANVEVTLLFEGLAPVTRTFAVGRTSRKTIDVGHEFPEARGREFGALVESKPVGADPPAQIAVERAIYNNALGAFWAAGNNALATRLR